MTEKRFMVDDCGTLIDMWSRDSFDYVGDVVGLLNDYDKENNQLKSKNKGLQSELQIFKEDVTHSNLQINKLADENEQLKKELHQQEVSEQRRKEYDDFWKEKISKVIE